MLVLSRKSEDSIVIGSEIEVTVLSVSGQRVKLGIRAPGHVRIVRGELVPEQGIKPIVQVGDLLGGSVAAGVAPVLPR
ncbi:MAG: hypothetical protein A2W31_01190 [Planctomycetes bacterium RBG_16_64_10]|nr:MAG: hypothetical protein A2W31_01190 [Planctomycetes bacterium RBG_16_64_10]